MKSTAATSLPRWKIYGYGLGEFGFNFFLVFISYHLMYFLTDIAGFPTKTAAGIYSVAQWLETLSLLAAGFLIDRIRLRGGRYRPWMVLGSAVCMVGMILFFTRLSLPIPVYTIVFPVLYLIAYWGYNFMWVGYRAIMGFVAQNPKDNVSLTTAASLMGTVAMLLFSALGEQLLLSFADPAVGYTISAAIYGALMLISMILVSKLAKPYDNDLSGRLAPAQQEKKARLPLKDIWLTIKGPMLPFFLAFVLRSCVQMIIPALVVYHFQLVLHKPEGVQMYLLCYTAGQMLGLFFVPSVAGRIGKRRTFLLSSLGTVVLLCCAWFVRDDLVPFLALMTLNAFVTSFGASLLPAFLTDIADHNEYERGLSTRSFAVSLGATSITVASLVGGGIAAFGLAATGYDASLPQQSLETITSISKLMLIGGAAFAGSSIIPMLFYRLDESKLASAYEKRREQQQ